MFFHLGHYDPQTITEIHDNEEVFFIDSIH